MLQPTLVRSKAEARLAAQLQGVVPGDQAPQLALSSRAGDPCQDAQRPIQRSSSAASRLLRRPSRVPRERRSSHDRTNRPVCRKCAANGRIDATTRRIAFFRIAHLTSPTSRHFARAKKGLFSPRNILFRHRKKHSRMLETRKSNDPELESRSPDCVSLRWITCYLIFYADFELCIARSSSPTSCDL
jgi:hypothetical protein